MLGCTEVPVNNGNVPPPPQGSDGGVDMADAAQPPTGPAWYWESPRPQGNNFRALWGIAGATSSQDQLFAGGDSGTLVIGSSLGWQVQRGYYLDNRSLLGIGGQGSGAQAQILAVGSFDYAIRRLSGQWSDLNPLLGTGDGSLNAVWPTPTAGEFFVAGTTGRLYYVRGGGTTWLPEGAGATSDSLFGITGAPNGTGYDVYAVGASGRIVHRPPGANTWTVEADNLVGEQLNAVTVGDGALAGDVFAVGNSGRVLHRTGGSWQMPETTPTMNDLLAVWGHGDEVYAVGARGTILRRQAGFWKDETTPLTSERLSALWGTVHDGLPVVYAAGNLGTILRRERGTWEQLSSRVTTNPLSGVWARSPGEVYAVGANGTVLRRNGTPANGSWVPAGTGLTTSALNAVTGYAATASGALADVYAVGADGTILHQTSDGTWSAEGVALTSAELTAVWAGADSVWVVGRGGRIGKRIAGVWSNENGPGNMPVMQDLFSVWGIGQGTGQITYAGGAQGLILRRELGVWKQEAAGTTTDAIVALFGSSEGDLYAFGDKGTVLHRVGGTWRSTPVKQFLSGSTGVAGTTVPGSSELYAVGTQGLILHYSIQGSTMAWVNEPSLTPLPGSSISAAAVNDVYVVGPNGLILHKY